MNNINKINFFYLFFILLIIFSLVQGYYCKYNEFNICKEIFKNYWNESGFIENLQTIFIFFSIIILVLVKLRFSGINFINLFLIVKIFGLIYYLGEEISWGQHYFKWSSPELFKEINNQKETNLHNISNLFDQLPRTLVYFWCAFSVILINLNILKKNISEKFYLIICPDKKLIYISFLLLILSIPDLIVDLFNLHPGHVDQFGNGIPEAIFFDFITFNYVRLSELHELIFSFYFLFYSIFIYKDKFLSNY